MARGLGLQNGILARTAAPLEANGELGDDLGDPGTNGHSKGASPGRRRRGRRPRPEGKISGRKFQLPDSVFERLVLHSLKKKTNASAVLTEILDRELPQHRIATDETPKHRGAGEE